MGLNNLFVHLLILFSLAVAGLCDASFPIYAPFFFFCLFLVLTVFGNAWFQDDCVFTVYVRTGSAIKGGTDSIISLRLYDANGWYVEIPNLEAWGGIMQPGHNYYERGNLDIFSGRAPCLTAPACALNLTSDGSGDNHGWYCNYVEVTTTGPHVPCAQQLFTVEQWLATDISPFELTAIRNSCSYGVDRLSHAVMKSSASSSM